MTTGYKTVYREGYWVLEHRWKMERHIGRKLRTNEIVHHKNGNGFDNRLRNLELMTRQEHARHHQDRHPRSKPCSLCGELFNPRPTARLRAKTCSKKCWRLQQARTLAATHARKRKR